MLNHLQALTGDCGFLFAYNFSMYISGVNRFQMLLIMILHCHSQAMVIYLLNHYLVNNQAVLTVLLLQLSLLALKV